MTGVAFLNAIVFGVYGNVERKIGDQKAISTHCIAGATAGLSQSIVCSPIEMVKTRLQLQNNYKSAVQHKNPVDCLKYIFKHEGFRGVFRGTGLTAARDVPGKYPLSYIYIEICVLIKFQLVFHF
jgi:solute carrier family 25 carnitine/acylcarnitine transporter 20/29